MRAILSYLRGDGSRGTIHVGKHLTEAQSEAFRRLRNEADFSPLFDADAAFPSGNAEQYWLMIEDAGVPIQDGWFFGKNAGPELRSLVEWLLEHGDPWQKFELANENLLHRLPISPNALVIKILSRRLTSMARVAADGGEDVIVLLEAAESSAIEWLESLTKDDDEHFSRFAREG